ncbi:MAG: MlaD family protein, partial [Kiloniellales bacterium]
MAKKADPKKIGAFVVGAAVLVVVGLVVFASGQFFAKTRTFVLFFESSVGGLNVGAPVNFRGVRVGSVKDIVLRYNLGDDSLLIPVYVEFEPGRIEGVDLERPKSAKQLIERGLRAQLGMQSFVTGQLSVEFDFHPGSPVRLAGAEIEYPELPTLPSDMAKLKATITRVAEKVSALPLEEIIGEVTRTV